MIDLEDPLFDLAELVRRLNAVSQPRSDGRPRWTRWAAIRQLQKHRVRLVQAVPRGKYWLTPRALREAWPELHERLLEEEGRARVNRNAA